MATSEGFDPAEATRYAAVADHFGFLHPAEFGNWTDQEILAAASVVVIRRDAAGAAVSLVELLARRLTSQATPGRWNDADSVELAKLLLQGLAWRLPEESDGRSQQAL